MRIHSTYLFELICTNRPCPKTLQKNISLSSGDYFNVFPDVSVSTRRKPLDFCINFTKILICGSQMIHEVSNCPCMTYGLTALSPPKETRQDKHRCYSHSSPQLSLNTCMHTLTRVSLSREFSPFASILTLEGTNLYL